MAYMTKQMEIKMINIYNILFFVFGIILDYLNNVVLKKTINIFLIKKNRAILLLSFLVRLLVFLSVFIIISLVNIKQLYFLFFGLIFSKIMLLIIKYISRKK